MSEITWNKSDIIENLTYADLGDYVFIEITRRYITGDYDVHITKKGQARFSAYMLSDIDTAKNWAIKMPIGAEKLRRLNNAII